MIVVQCVVGRVLPIDTTNLHDVSLRRDAASARYMVMMGGALFASDCASVIERCFLLYFFNFIVSAEAILQSHI